LTVVDVAIAALVAVPARLLWLETPVLAVALLVVCWAALLALLRAVEASLVESRVVVCARVVRAAGLLVIVGAVFALVSPTFERSGEVVTVAALWAAASCVLRTMVPHLGAGRSRSGLPLVVVSAGADHRTRAVATLEHRLGRSLPLIEVSPDGDAAVADRVAAVALDVEAGAVVAFPGGGLDAATLRRMQWELERVRLPLFIDPGVLGVAPSRLQPSAIGDLTLVRIRGIHRAGLAWHLWGVIGRLGAGLGLLLILPALLAIAFAITRTSPGAAIYRQSRVGRDGREFTIFKFRTMTAAAARPDDGENEFDGVLFKIRLDPRVTPLGRWLRRYSIDELPQLINVVLGDMRLVGPRPALPDEVAQYVDDDHRRLAVPPGLTGLWQVSGRSDLTWEESVRLDQHYVDNWSPTLDLIILCRTVRAVLGHRGAY